MPVTHAPNESATPSWPTGHLQNSLRRHSALPQMPDAQRVLPFRQPHPRGVPYQFAMEIVRCGVPECAHQQQLPRCGLQQIRAPHDFRDHHRRVVDHDRELLSGNIVTPPDQKIAEITAHDIALPAQIQIRELNLLAVGNAKPPVHARRLHELGPILAFTTSPRIHRIIVRIVRSARRLRQILARTIARIQKPALPQPPPSLQIVRAALTLRVRAIGPATIRALAPTNAQPAQILNHGAGKFRPRPLPIQILIPQDQSSLVLDRPLRRDPEGPRMPNMQQPRRRRCQASAITGSVESARGFAHRNILAGSAAGHGQRVAGNTACMTVHALPRQVRP